MDDAATVPADSPAATPPRRTFELLFLALLFAAAFLIRLWGVSRMHVWDENVYLQNALLICCGKTNFNEIDSRPPLLSLFFAAAFHLWRSDYAAYIVTSFLNALGPVFLYLSGRIAVGRRAAAIAALLLGFTPFFVSVFPPGYWSMVTGHGLLSDSPALTLILLAFWLLLLALQADSAPLFAAAGFVLALTVLMRFPSLSSVGVLSLLTLLAARRLRAMLASALGFTLGMAPYLCWSRWQYGGFLATFRNGWDNFSGPGQSPLFYLKNAPVIFGWLTLVGLALWIANRALYLWTARQQPLPWRSLLRNREAFLLLWAIVLLACFSALSHKEPRYAMPAAPPLFLLAGVGLSILLRAHRKPLRMAGTATLAVLLCVAFWPIHRRFAAGFIDRTVSQEMLVSAFLNQTAPPGTVVYTNLSYPDFGFYTNLPVEVLPEDGPDLYDSFNTVPTDGIVIAYKIYEGRAPQPSIAWLDANPHYTRLREFPTMVVYRFHAKPLR